MINLKEAPRPSENTQESPESFNQRFGEIFGRKINGLLEKNVPGFSQNGISPKEKDFHRVKLTLRILVGVVSELVRSGRGELTEFVSELEEKLAKEHAEIEKSLLDEEGKLPPDIQKRVDYVRDRLKF